MSKFLNLQIDDEVMTIAESILDDIGIDSQTFVKMCFKKLNKEQSISFLTSTGTATIKQDKVEQITPTTPNIDSAAFNDPIRTKNVITAEMRDYIWNIFKTQYNAHQKIDCTYLSKLAHNKTGITQGSAYIYFLILDNLMAGVPNTRTMKFDDLVVYLRYISEQLPKVCLDNAVKSLSESIPYWKKTLQGHFYKKVSDLISQYR